MREHFKTHFVSSALPSYQNQVKALQGKEFQANILINTGVKILNKVLTN